MVIMDDDLPMGKTVPGLVGLGGESLIFTAWIGKLRVQGVQLLAMT
jgi:hypothetical protein